MCTQLHKKYCMSYESSITNTNPLRLFSLHSFGIIRTKLPVNDGHKKDKLRQNADGNMLH